MLTLNDAESHILAASPYFAGQYLTPNGKCCEMEEGDSKLVTGSGYTEEGRVVKILSENVFYNREYKAYRVLVTDGPLEGLHRRVAQSPGTQSDRRMLTAARSRRTRSRRCIRM